MKTDQKNFGKYEPGNKIYYTDLEDYFSQNETFRSKGVSFSNDIIPEFQVVFHYEREKVFSLLKLLVRRLLRKIKKLASNSSVSTS